MSRSSSADASASDPAKKRRYVCPDCDKAFSTSSHLGRHSRVHTGEKNYKCDFPGCETRCSRLDNLHAHQRVHLAPQPRAPKGSKKTRARKSDAATNSPASSSASSPSPTTPFGHLPLPPEIFSAPASRSSSVSAGNSPQPPMLRHLPPLSRSGPPRSDPSPFYQGPYSGLEDLFNEFSIPSSQRSRLRAEMPYSRPMPPPIVRGSPDESLDSFNSMLLQNATPMRGQGFYQPQPSTSSHAAYAQSAYPYATYRPQLHMPQYPPPRVPSSRTPSHTPSPPHDFPELHQLPQY
ncbi:hypothetical protein B0H16DRAFT_292729 [Mycena metata]|uniref:C2H2-type domain-containing protein n=1 Tax=Mycena metata TaxID=1033252 RepID=A0AAD7KEX2_9AGAR|nr:hypothetical protein B0H16DRAFT_292729 [Mycena metata]